MIFVLVMPDQVGDHLGVGLRLKDAAVRREPFFQLEIVLDDPVVHDDDPAGAVDMRMRILFGGAAVRGPARVTDPVGAG